MDLEEAEFALDDLQRWPHVGGLQRDVGATKDFVARRDFDEQLRHAGDRHVALTGRGDMRRRLRLHAVDERVGAKLKVHRLAHCNAKGRDQFGMRVADRRKSRDIG